MCKRFWILSENSFFHDVAHLVYSSLCIHQCFPREGGRGRKDKVGWLKPPPVLTGGYNRLKPPRSILPKVVNTSQLKILVVDWSYIWSMDQLKGLKNNCFARHWLTVYYLASIVGVQLGLKCPLSALVLLSAGHISPGVPSISNKTLALPSRIRWHSSFKTV